MILTKDKIESLNLYGKIDDELTKGNVDKFLLIVPTNRKLRAVKKKIIDLSPQQTVTKINIETLSTISTKLLEHSTQFIQLSEAAASVFIKMSAEQVKLQYFTNYKDSIPNGTLDRIKNVISEYKKHGITPEVLLRESELLETSEKLKAIDIAEIYKKYNILTDEINAYELGDIYEKLKITDSEKIEESFTKLYPNLEFAALLGFDQFTLPEIEIISAVSEILNSKLYIDFDYSKYNPLIFSHLEDTYRALERFGFKKIEDKSVYEFNDFTKAVREKLFLRNDSSKVKNFQNNISVINGRNTEEEIQLIAKEIKALILNSQIQPNNICVAFNLISDFSPLVRDTFERYGIPFNLTDRTSLDQSSPVIAVINVLEILENDFYYKNIFRAFSGRFLQHYNIDTVNLNIIASKLKIVSGYNNWLSTIKNEIELENGDDEKINNERLKSALEDLKKMDEILKPFDQKLTPTEFFNELVNLITKSNIAVTILEGHSDYREEDIAALSTFIETLDEILQLIEKQNDQETKYSLSFYLDQIKTASSWARFNIKGRSDYGVLVTSVNEIRGLTFDYLFIAGMNDGIFPTRYTPEIFFSGSFAKKEITHQTEERYHFYQALSTWRKHLYLASASVGEDKELVESVFLKDFKNLFECEEISNLKFDRVAYSTEEVQILNGRIITMDQSNTNAVELDPELKKKVNVQKLRSNSPHEPNEYNGFVKINSDKKIDDALAKFANREYSITQLETYAKCPFKYFMQYVLRLTEIGEPTEEVEPIEIGSVLHKILYDFFSELREQKISLKDCTESTFKKAEEIIFQIAEKNVESPLFFSELSFYEKERILGIDGNRKDSILYQFLINEKNNKSETSPSYFEVAFGSIGSKIRDKHLSHQEPIEGNGVKFRGKIDRLDTDEEYYDVVDYKLSLSSKPTKSDINEGISLQLPLYMFAAKQLFERNEIELSPGKVFLYSLKFGENDLRKQSISLIDKKAENRQNEIDNLIQETLKKIKDYVERIVKGEFPLTSLKDRENKVCKYCDFTKICRVEETEL